MTKVRAMTKVLAKQRAWWARAAAKAKGKTTTKGIGNDKGKGNDEGKAKGNGKDEKGTGKARARKALARRAFSAAENDMIIKLSWQAWDWLVDRIARASADELRRFVSEPERLIKNRAKIAIVAQVPGSVYLDCGTADRPQYSRVYLGQEEIPDREKLTLVMRHALEGYFDEGLEMPKGEMLDFVLLVLGNSHARLEDMSMDEPSVWLRTHKFDIDGISVHRQKGQRVGCLGLPWRKARRQAPHLFYKTRVGEEGEWRQGCVRVWFQRKATEDRTIASMLSDLIVEETRHIFMEAFLNVDRARNSSCN